ncbi:MAG TPA: BatD family protein [Verrucomicrobiae bacterium]
MRRSKFLFIAILAVLSFWFHPVCAAPSVSAALDRQNVAVGEEVVLSLNFDEVNPGAPPNMPALPNLTYNGVSQSSSVTIVNGAMQSKLTYNYAFTATQPGDVVIPAFKISAGGRDFTTQPIKLSIGKAAVNPENAVTNIAWVKLIIPKNEVYVGEAFPVEMQLYFQNAQELQMPQIKGDGFSFGQNAKPQQTRTQIGGKIFNLIIFKTSASAAKVGNFEFGPVDCSLTLLIPDPNPRRRDPFDPFSMFGGDRMQPRPTTLHSDVRPMRVLALPSENVPETFNGAVGSFNMNVSAGPKDVAVGDPVTVKVSIQGNGAIDALRLPEQPQWRDFKTYPPSAKTELADPLGLSGTKSFEQVIIPQNHEIRALPPLQFSFFDPNLKSYRTLSGPAFPLNVRATPSAVAPPTASNTVAATANNSAADDIVHIKAQLAQVGPTGAPLILRPWFWGLQALPLVAWLGLLVNRKRSEALANNPKLRRKREVATRVRQGREELRQFARGQQSDDFFGVLFRLLQEILGERLDLPAAAITEAVLDESRAQQRLTPEIIQSSRELFQICDQARYAPLKSSQELASIIPKLESMATQAQNLKN